MHRFALLPATLVACAVAAGACSSGTTSAPQPPTSAPKPSPPPQITIPRLAVDGGVSCAKSDAADCLPWRQPQPANASWRDIVAVHNQTVDDAPVGASYLCGMFREADLHTLAGPNAVRALDGRTCIINSYEGPGWVTSKDGHITVRVAFGQAPHTSSPTRSARTVTGPDGTSVAIRVHFDQGTQPDASSVAADAAQHLQSAIHARA